jgi:light-regulated signal transduction histidine kinase (bacteriophytochrome)
VKDFAVRLERDFAERLGEEGRHIMQVISEGCRNMDEMVVGLLSFSRATSQRLNLVDLDMTAIVRTSIAEARAVHSNPEAQVEISPQPLPSAAADPVVIRHVWSNLIGNAFKYSARRADPQIRISGRTEGDETIFTVADNGTGFDMQYADKLFGVFKRLHSSRDFPGTGVGLAIAHRIITRHGGRISAQAAPGKGARFEFTLPSTVRSADLRAAAGPSNS